MSKKLLLAASAVAILNVSPALAASDTDLEALRAEIQAMRDAYESKIEQLESKVQTLEAKQAQTAQQVAAVEPAAGNVGAPATAQRNVKDSSFNPAVGIVLNGKYNKFSEDDGDIAGFAIGEEGERGKEGLGIDETELNFSASVDDKFRGSATIALHEHEGETEVEIEEAFIATTALPAGLEVKAGRFFSELGYLNSHHSHADDFADRPLTNRAFLDGNFGDDGVQVSAVLPTPIYTEVGGGIFRGDDFPAGGADGSDIGAWTAYGRIGGDVGDNTSWRLGLSTLQTDSIDRDANEDEVNFTGDSNLYIADARAVYAPTGNNAEQELILQGEYFYRDEDGTYEDTDAGTGAINYDDSQSGWYAQSVYKFHPQWRVGARYSQLYAGDVPAGLVGSALDDGGHDPWAATAMVDWTNSEFSRIRAQFSREEVADGQEDNQFTLQYIMSLGAHGAHNY
jgi:outer membrane murein-binding lipoprotein Lpp